MTREENDEKEPDTGKLYRKSIPYRETSKNKTERQE